MGYGLTIEECNNSDELMQVFSHPAIWDAISYDGEYAENAHLPKGEDHVYLLMKYDGLKIGAAYFHYRNPRMVEFHPSVLPLYRSIHSYDAVKRAISWMFNTTNIEKITVQIPECFEHVVKFAKRQGFEEEGCFHNAYPRNDKMIDINLLGLTRLQWADS
jgi:RimJ/RimL family protein N-acetyltransferase